MTLRLSKRNIVISDLRIDLHNGLNLVLLIEVLSKKPFPYTYFKEIKRDIHCQENLSLCLKVLKEYNLKMLNIDAFDIFDGNLKLTLGAV